MKGVYIKVASYLISEAAHLADVEPHVLRYWEEELNLAIPRNELGHRYYTEKHIEMFKKIKIFKERGYQLKAIRANLYEDGEGAPVIAGEDGGILYLSPNGAYNMYNVAPEGKYNVAPEGKYNGVPEGKYNVAPEGKYSGAAEGKYNVTSESKYNEAATGKYNGVPENTYSEAGKLKQGETTFIRENETLASCSNETENLRGLSNAGNAESLRGAENLVNVEALRGADRVMNVENLRGADNARDLKKSDGEDKLNRFKSIMTEIVADAMAVNNAMFTREVSRDVGDRIIKEMNYLAREREEQEEERFKKFDELLRGYQRGSKAKAEAAAAKEIQKKHRKERRRRKKLETGEMLISGDELFEDKTDSGI